MSPRAPDSVCFLTNRLDRAGAEVQVGLLAARLSRRGWRVSVVSIAAPRAVPPALAEAGVPVHSLGLAGARTTPAGLLRLLGVLRRERPAVLHAHLFHANLAARLVRLLHWTPVLVCSAHSVREGGRWRDLAYRLSDPLASCTTAVGRAVAERQRRDRIAPPRKLRVIPNGIDLAALAPDGTRRRAAREALGLGSRFAWLCVARFVPAKNHANLLRAWQRVTAPDRVLLLAGEGHLEADSRALRRTLGLEESVRFLGARDDVAQLLSASDACVSASDWEGLPLSLLEAAAAARPAVATRAGGCAEIVEEGITGLLVPPRDADALARAMERMMGLSAAGRASLGGAARARAEAHFGIDAVVDAWEALYAELASRR